MHNKISEGVTPPFFDTMFAISITCERLLYVHQSYILIFRRMQYSQKR